MPTGNVSGLVRRYFTAYETRDRPAIEELLSDDFTFTSPRDDHIDRAAYFERCWPYSEIRRTFHIVNLFENGNEAFVRYDCKFEGHGGFRNTEYFRIAADRIAEICVYFGEDAAPEAGEAQVRTLLENWVEAVRRKDVDARMANYAPDVVSFDAVGSMRLTGSAAIRTRLQEWFALYDGPIGYEIGDLSIMAGDDVAFSHALNCISGTLRDGRKIDMWVRETCCFRNVHGKWLATHTHVSVPFDGNSDKASLDLEP